MSAPVKTWTSLPANAETDAALRVAAAGVVSPGWSGSETWRPEFSRDDLAMVFQVGLLRAADKRKRGKFWTIYEMTLTSPRAALCALLDLLSVPVPQELHQ